MGRAHLPMGWGAWIEDFYVNIVQATFENMLGTMFHSLSTIVSNNS
jgi:hypothetical protein